MSPKGFIVSLFSLGEASAHLLAASYHLHPVHVLFLSFLCPIFPPSLFFKIFDLEDTGLAGGNRAAEDTDSLVRRVPTCAQGQGLQGRNL